MIREKKERVKLTEARAMLLYMLYQLVKNGEFVSEFSKKKYIDISLNHLRKATFVTA